MLTQLLFFNDNVKRDKYKTKKTNTYVNEHSIYNISVFFK